jgi:hypothetical protein
MAMGAGRNLLDAPPVVERLSTPSECRIAHRETISLGAQIALMADQEAACPVLGGH